jgi:transposase
MGKSCPLSAVDRQKLQQWTAAHGTPQQVALRCRIVLAAALGESDVAIAKRLSVNRNTVILWRKRFSDEGLDGLWDIAPGRGRKPTYPIDKIAAIVDATLQTKPAGMTHWSCRTMAQSQGVGKSTVNNIWRAHNLQPHRQTFKLSRDPKFLEKMTDVVGLYLNPPQQAIVLSVDEKSQIPAWDRTQPGLPIQKGQCATMAHDYQRNGSTTTLFAALDTLQGKVVGACHQRHRHREFLKFLRRLHTEFPGDVPLHLIMDNYGTHNHAKVKAWLKRNPRFVSHFVPTSSSWMNLVERWFGHLHNKAIRRGVWLDLADLEASIDAFPFLGLGQHKLPSARAKKRASSVEQNLHHLPANSASNTAKPRLLASCRDLGAAHACPETLHEPTT